MPTRIAVLLLAVPWMASAQTADEPHDRFTIVGIKIGMPLAQKDFVCNKAAGQCVKFMDKRCTGKKANLGVKRYGEDAPKGCFLDTSSGATYLDGRLLQQSIDVSNAGKPGDPSLNHLVNVLLAGTKTKESKVFRITYEMAVDDLASGDKASDSKLYRALVAKYGTPDEIWSGKVKWKAGSTLLVGACTGYACTLEAEDSLFERMENEAQEEADTAAKHKSAPDPEL